MINKKFIKLRNYLIKHWVLFLVSLSLLFFIINIIIFYPGYMSNDSIWMYYAARGDVPSDLAPVMLGLIWRILYNLTGKTSSILIFQLSMLWSSLCLFSIYTYKKTKSKKLSLLCLAVGCLPFVFNLSGVIWRDSQMTFALMLSIALLLFLEFIKNKKWRLTLFILSILLIIYASVSRYNAIIATVPIMFLDFRMSGYVKKLRWQLAIAIALIPLTFLVLFPSINYSIGATKSNNQPGLLLDDIIEVSSEDSLKEMAMPDDLRTNLLIVKKCSVEKGILVDNIGFCSNNDNRLVLYVNHNEFQNIWLNIITNNPIGYIKYKAKMFWNVILPINSYSYIWQDGIVPNKYSETVQFQGFQDFGFAYVQISGRYLRATFEPWFWILASSIILYLSIKKRNKNGLVINVLCISAILYILGYIPTGAAADYRYIYWSVLATIFAFVLYRADKH